MEQWIIQFAISTPYAPYLVLVAVVIFSGFGLPIPEDVPILLGGYLAASIDTINPWFMFLALFVAVLGADSIVFWLGRKYGHHVRSLPLIKRYLTDKHMAKAEMLLNKHGGKFAFVARFLPGLRTPAILTAGTFKLPYWKLLVFDGSAALISVPVIFALAYYFASEIDQVRKWIQDGQIVAISVIAVIIVLIIGLKIWFKKYRAKKHYQD